MSKLKKKSVLLLCTFAVFSFSCYKKLEICPDNGERNEFKIEVSSISTNSGKYNDNIEIKGSNFIGGNDDLYEVLFFGNVNATNIEVINSSTIKATIPPKPLHALLESSIIVKYNGACPEKATALDMFYYEYQIVSVDSLFDNSIFGDLKGLTTDFQDQTGVDLFVTDAGNSVIHKIRDNFSNGLSYVELYAGKKGQFSSNDSEQNLDKSLFNMPNDIAMVKGSDNQFIIDATNRQIRRINKVQGIGGTIHNSAGNRKPGFTKIDSTTTCNKSFGILYGIAVNENNDRVYVSDLGTQFIYELKQELTSSECSFIDSNDTVNIGDAGIVYLRFNLSEISKIPFGLDVDNSKKDKPELLVAVPESNQILRYDLTNFGNSNINTIDLEDNDKPKDIKIDVYTGTIFYIDNNSNRVGYYNTILPTPIQRFEEEIRQPQGIALSNNGHQLLLYISSKGGIRKLTIQ